MDKEIYPPVIALNLSNSRLLLMVDIKSVKLHTVTVKKTRVSLMNPIIFTFKLNNLFFIVIYVYSLTLFITKFRDFRIDKLN